MNFYCGSLQDLEKILNKNLQLPLEEHDFSQSGLVKHKIGFILIKNYLILLWPVYASQLAVTSKLSYL